VLWEGDNLNSFRLVNWILPALVTVLALADGVLHFSLDMLLFRGNFVGRLGPPPGSPPPAAPPPPGPPIPLPLPLNQMFVINCIGYLILVGLFWFALRRAASWRTRVDVLFLLYVAGALLAWVDLGMPNPRGLGYLSKTVEIVLAIALISHIWLLSRSAAPAEPAFALQTDVHR
jgi:hypothetical protein